MGLADNLHEIMNDVSAHLDRATPSFMPAKHQVLGELEAFLMLDPLLADLHKQFLDAKHNRQQAAKEYGKGDGMTDMAAILEDSAWCAMQTRYMEIRSNRRQMANAQKLINDSIAEEKRLEKIEREKEALKAFEQMQMFARMKAPKENNNADLWLLMLFLFTPNKQEFFRDPYASYRFNRLAA